MDENDLITALLARLRPQLQAAQVPMPEAVAQDVPEIFVKLQVRELANAYADHLRGAGLYLQGEDVVTIHEGTGRTRLMTPERFVGWSEDFIAPWSYDKDRNRKYVSISPLTAKLILVSDHFRCKLPPLVGVNMVKLPVVDPVHGFRLLAQGYDAESGIFTVRGGIDYPEDIPWADAVERLRALHFYFPWGDDGRSLGVHISSMLTVFCQGMLPPGARVPLFLYNSNVPGSGKSQLVKLALLLVHGRAGVATLWERAEEFKKELDSAAQQLEPFLFFDDLGGYLQNNLLNGWLTSARWDGRIMGTRERFSVPLRAITFATGNQLRLSEDLGRRTLIVDLFATEVVTERVLPADVEVITDDWILREETRAYLLGCIFALVREAFGKGEAARLAFLAKMRPLASFEAWSLLVPAVAVASGFGDPLQVVRLPDAGSSDATDRARTVQRAIVDFVLPLGAESVSVTLVQLCIAARREGCYLDALGSTEEVVRELDGRRGAWPLVELMTPVAECINGDWVDRVELERRAPVSEPERAQVAEAYMDRPQCSSFGKRVRKALNMTFKAGGSWWAFGTREDARKSTFLFRRLPPPSLPVVPQ